MPLSAIGNQLLNSISEIENNLSQDSKFKVYSFVSGEDKKTGEISLIVSPKIPYPAKLKTKFKAIQSHFETCIEKTTLPQIEDKAVQQMIAFLTNDGEEYKISKDQLLYLLKRQYAGIKLNYWITKNFKYKFNTPDQPAVKIQAGNNENAFYTLISSLNMREEGISLLIDDKLNEIIKKDFPSTNLPLEKEEQTINESLSEIKENSDKIEQKIIEQTHEEHSQIDSTQNKSSSEDGTEQNEITIEKIEKKNEQSTEFVGLNKPIHTNSMQIFGYRSKENQDQQENQRKELSAQEKIELARKRLKERHMKKV